MALWQPTIKILLADDDKDDNLLFELVLKELPLLTHLTIVRNGEQLMTLLNDHAEQLPHVLFLDLNMPRKHGFDCLLEIKRDKRLKHFPVVIISTSYEPKVVNLLYKNEALYYIRKPNDFTTLKDLVHEALILATKEGAMQPSREKFMLLKPALKHEKG